MLIITDKMIKELKIDNRLIISIIEETIKNKNYFLLPLKTSIKLPDNGFYNTMPSIIDDYYSCKIVIRNTNKQPSISGDIILYNINDSELLSIMDCRFITSIRTGSVALITIKYLAIKNFNNISLIGLGESMGGFMKCYNETYGNRKVNIHLMKYKDHCEKFINTFNNDNINWIIHTKIEDLFKNADIIISAVTVQNNIFVEDTNIYKKGVLIIPIHTNGFQNCDIIFDKVVVDDDKHVTQFKNYGKFKKYCELTDIINGVSEGRTSDNERILAYNIGLAIHDNKLASLIYNKIILKPINQ